MRRVARSPIARYRNANKPARSPMARYRNASEPAVKNHDARPIVAVHVDNDDDISVLTTPSVVKRPTVPSRHATYSKRELGYDLILEEAWADTEIHQVRNQRQIEDEYIQRHGLQEQGSLRQHPHAPYGGPSPIDPRRVQSRHASSNPMPSTVGRRTSQFAPPQFPEEIAPPQFYEGHHWPVQGDQYRPELSSRPRHESLPTGHPPFNSGMRSGPHARSEPHYPGHHSNGYGRENEQGPYMPRKRSHSSGYGRESEHGPYRPHERPRGYNSYNVTHDVMYSTSPQIQIGTPRLSNPPRRQDADGYEEFPKYAEYRKRMV